MLASTPLPLFLRYGKVVEVALAFFRRDPPRARPGRPVRAPRRAGSPAGLLGVDGEGRIESANRRFAEWTGRRVEVLEGMDVERAAVLPEALRRELRALALLRRRSGGACRSRRSSDEDVLPLTPDGDPRPVPRRGDRARAGGGVDVLLVDVGVEAPGLGRGSRVRPERARRGTGGCGRGDRPDDAATSRSPFERIVAAVRKARGTSGRARSSGRRRDEGGLDMTTRADPEAPPVRTLSGPDASLPSQGGPAKPVVLLVEDNEENRELLAHMLRSRGADVVACGSGREALEAAARERFTFVLLDLQMPEMDGHQVLQRLRALPGGGALPVVALTALTSENVRHRCEAEGMNDFVTKPVTLGRIRELVDRWGGPAARVSGS